MTSTAFTVQEITGLVEGVNTITVPAGAQLLGIGPAGELRALADPTASPVDRLIAVLQAGAPFPWTRAGPAFYLGTYQLTAPDGDVTVDVFDGGETTPTGGNTSVH